MLPRLPLLDLRLNEFVRLRFPETEVDEPELFKTMLTVLVLCCLNLLESDDIDIRSILLSRILLLFIEVMALAELLKRFRVFFELFGALIFDPTKIELLVLLFTLLELLLLVCNWMTSGRFGIRGETLFLLLEVLDVSRATLFDLSRGKRSRESCSSTVDSTGIEIGD